tara:strand:+ start:187 stop:861 length:675 start_codon:yes stop_codon:yes gene_type:complete
MLNLSQSLSLSAIKESWSPTDETSVVAWYRNKTGITLNGTDVSDWADSANSYDMEQDDADEQPAYNTSTGALTFDSSDAQNLQTSSQISLTGAFTIGIRLYPTGDFDATFLGDNTSNNYLFKYTSTSNIRVKIGGTAGNIPLDSGTFGDDYLVITRDGSNVITLHKNGVAQSTTITKSGTALIDAIGVRATDINSYDGTISEVQIYSSTSSDLTATVNDYLSSI